MFGSRRMPGRHLVERRRLFIPLCFVLLAAACAGGNDNAASGASADTEVGAHAPRDPLEITTDLGVVRGRRSDIDGILAFLAMPYAAPPTGEDRWRPPRPRAPYRGVLDATGPGASCPQDVGSLTAQLTRVPKPDEDCLTLDVWSPADAKDLPVMVWIHGGGLIGGSAHQPYYVGDDLASEGVVVVGINYRLGPFGFLATEALAAESDDGSYGNYGLADQAAALEWVQRNVRGFGGDPANVTIFGESSGGSSVCAHLASPASKGLFDRAIIQSGVGCYRSQRGQDAQVAGAALLAAVGCPDIACMRNLPSAAIVAAAFAANFVTDGVRLSDTGRARAQKGELDDIEVLIGSNADEALIFTLTTAEPTEAALLGLFAELSDEPAALLALYPSESYKSNLDRYRTMVTDVRYTCPTIAFAEVADNKTYVYHYTYKTAPGFALGPTHGAELALLFAHPEGISGAKPGLTGTDAGVSSDMQAAWAAFAKTGVPGSHDTWRPYADGGSVTLIDRPFALVEAIRGGRCKAVGELATERPS